MAVESSAELPVPDAEAPEVVAPPTLRSVAGQYGRRFLVEGFAPLLIFLVANLARGLAWAMGAATAWAVGVMIVRRINGKSMSAFVWVVLGYVLVRGAAGIASHSDAVYFGPGVVNNFVIGLVLVGSVVVRRPIVGLIAPYFYPFTDEVKAHDAYRKVFGRLTLAWGMLQLSTATFQVWLLATASTTTFLLARSAVGWTLGIALFAVSLHYPRRAFARVPELADQVAAAEAAMSRRRWWPLRAHA